MNSDIDNEIPIGEMRYKKDGSLDDPYLDVIRIGEVVGHEEDNDNVEIMITDCHYIKFRLRDLLSCLGFEYPEME